MSASKQRQTYSIGEWYGRLFTSLTPNERRRYAELQAKPKSEREKIECPFRSTPEEPVVCSKDGGVCSLRKYAETDSGIVVPGGLEGALCTTCPSRFREGEVVFRWIGETLLGCSEPIVLGEIGFLQGTQGKSVGRIDSILVDPQLDPLEWCALEMQAVYFSGKTMSVEYQHLRESTATEMEFPSGNRHPDFRSSGPKRLMPQLQIKVPTLRRWGKKMAVVVDEAFFDALGDMQRVHHISNGDIVWFVVGYDDGDTQAKIAPREYVVTTLEDSVTGLTAGEAVSKEEFEIEIRAKAAKAPDTAQ
jgi:hypothetical protein